jgi:hypothetical protein
MEMKTQPSAKRVRFSTGMKQILEIERAVDSASCWYSSLEIANFRSEVREKCKLVFEDACRKEGKHEIMQDEETLRGLESLWYPQLGIERRRQKARAIKSVIIAQNVAREQMQQGKHIDSVRFIAFIAHKESAKAKTFAAMLGEADQQSLDAMKLACDRQHISQANALQAISQVTALQAY